MRNKKEETFQNKNTPAQTTPSKPGFFVLEGPGQPYIFLKNTNTDNGCPPNTSNYGKGFNAGSVSKVFNGASSWQFLCEAKTKVDYEKIVNSSIRYPGIMP